MQRVALGSEPDALTSNPYFYENSAYTPVGGPNYSYVVNNASRDRMPIYWQRQNSSSAPSGADPTVTVYDSRAPGYEQLTRTLPPVLSGTYNFIGLRSAKVTQRFRILHADDAYKVYFFQGSLDSRGSQVGVTILDDNSHVIFSNLFNKYESGGPGFAMQEAEFSPSLPAGSYLTIELEDCDGVPCVTLFQLNTLLSCTARLDSPQAVLTARPGSAFQAMQFTVVRAVEAYNFGDPVANRSVKFEVTGQQTGTHLGHDPYETSTDGSGRVLLPSNALVAGSRPGSEQLFISVIPPSHHYYTPAGFVGLIVQPEHRDLAIVKGDQQAAFVGDALFPEDLQVRVTGDGEAPALGVEVTLTITGATGTAFTSGGTTATRTTSDNGMTVPVGLIPGQQPNIFQVTASCPGAQDATFHLALAPARNTFRFSCDPEHIEIVRGSSAPVRVLLQSGGTSWPYIRVQGSVLQLNPPPVFFFDRYNGPTDFPPMSPNSGNDYILQIYASDDAGDHDGQLYVQAYPDPRNQGPRQVFSMLRTDPRG
jgi:hypothetical protein